MKNVRFVIVFIILVLQILISCALVASKNQSTSFYNIIPADKNNSEDMRWSSYLLTHLDHRCSESDAVKISGNGATGQKELLQIIIDENSKLPDAYSIHYSNGQVKLSARNNEQMLWLIYQFMGMLGQKDARFDVSDLPPSIWDFGQDAAGNVAFEYRSLYTPSNNLPDIFPILGVGNIDYDWAIWGHNLHKILDPGVTGIYAMIDGAENQDQYCFSSENLYCAVEKYILSNYGEHRKKGKPVRFVIMPNDNDLVCQCTYCKARGNTATSATPAVTAFVERLAKRFPEFLFFTSYYQTTATLPSYRLSPNVGVLISTMDLPMVAGFEGTKEGRSFTNLFSKWNQLCSHIYVWDYCRNFDDYFTPFPFLEIARERLHFYQKLGVKGVIFNGSGSDYASFDDMQTYVLARLLNDPEADIKKTLNRFYASRYPVSGSLLASYYGTIEQRCYERKVPLQIYGGIEDAIKEYLVPDEFISFFNGLDKVSKQSKGEERKQLNQLLTALSFTRLELSRTPLGKQNADENKRAFLDRLKGHTSFDNMSNYKEANGVLDDYVNYMNGNKVFRDNDGNNVLLGKTFKVCSQLDEGSKPISVLTDGFTGIPYDYHTGWLIVTADSLCVEFPSGNISQGVLQVGLLNAPRWHLAIPATVCVWQKNKKIFEARPELEDESTFQRMDVNINLSHIDSHFPLRMVIHRSNNKIAVDEVELLKQ